MQPTTQIAVRLPTDLVDFLDEQVAAGVARGRAELIARLLTKSRRDVRAEADLLALHAAGTLHDDEGLAVARASARHFTELD